MAEVKKANLPTSSITEEAEQAGEAFEQRQGNGIKAWKSLTPKKPAPARQERAKREPKPPVDPAKGFPISAKAAEQLIKGGFYKGPITQHSSAPQIAPSGGGRTASQTVGAVQHQYPTPDSNANFVYPKPAQPVSSETPLQRFWKTTI